MRVLISGGGTGGHIFPALAIANAVKRLDPTAEILFVGALGRMEMERVPAAGYQIKGLPVAGFDRKRLWRNFRTLWLLWKSMRLARKYLREFQPDVAVGVGGYASGPMLKAAQKAGIPTLLQEQNSYPGVTNKLLGKNAKHICVAYEGTERFFPADKIVMTGNPIRADLTRVTMTQAQAKQELGFDPAKPLVAVVGGSLGARTLNRAIAAGLDHFGPDCQLLWQTGKLYLDEYAPKAQGRPGVQAQAFLSRMDLVYRAADLIVSRAGASTISEIQALGKAALLVPSPNVSEDHQRKNAQALVDHGAAVMVLDKDADAQLVPTIAQLLADQPQLDRLGKNVKKMELPDADTRIAQMVIDLAKKQ